MHIIHSNVGRNYHLQRSSALPLWLNYMFNAIRSSKGQNRWMSQRQKRFHNKTKGIWKRNIKDRFDLIYCQIGKVNLDTLCAHLLCCMIIKRQFGSRPHTNLTKGVKFLQNHHMSGFWCRSIILLNLYNKIII